MDHLRDEHVRDGPGGLPRFRLAAAFLALTLAGCSSDRLERGPYVSKLEETSTPEGVRRTFTVCFNPLTQPDYQEKIDALVLETCGAQAAPTSEKTGACTLLHPNVQTYSCPIGE